MTLPQIPARGAVARRNVLTTTWRAARRAGQGVESRRRLTETRSLSKGTVR